MLRYEIVYSRNDRSLLGFGKVRAFCSVFLFIHNKIFNARYARTTCMANEKSNDGGKMSDEIFFRNFFVVVLLFTVTLYYQQISNGMAWDESNLSI